MEPLVASPMKRESLSSSFAPDSRTGSLDTMRSVVSSTVASVPSTPSHGSGLLTHSDSTEEKSLNYDGFARKENPRSSPIYTANRSLPAVSTSPRNLAPVTLDQGLMLKEHTDALIDGAKRPLVLPSLSPREASPKSLSPRNFVTGSHQQNFHFQTGTLIINSGSSTNGSSNGRAMEPSQSPVLESGRKLLLPSMDTMETAKLSPRVLMPHTNVGNPGVVVEERSPNRLIFESSPSLRPETLPGLSSYHNIDSASSPAYDSNVNDFTKKKPLSPRANLLNDAVLSPKEICVSSSPKGTPTTIRNRFSTGGLGAPAPSVIAPVPAAHAPDAVTKTKKKSFFSFGKKKAKSNSKEAEDSHNGANNAGYRPIPSTATVVVDADSTLISTAVRSTLDEECPTPVDGPRQEVIQNTAPVAVTRNITTASTFSLRTLVAIPATVLVIQAILGNDF